MLKLKALLLTQGMHGMISQVEGLAKALNLNFKHQSIKLKSFWNFIPPKYTPISENLLTEKFICDSKVIISCGRKSIIHSIALKKRFKKDIFNIHIQNPKVSLDHFDMVVCPEHDDIEGKNVLKTIGAIHYLTNKEIKVYHNYLKINEQDKKIVTFIIGGPNRYYDYSEEQLNLVFNKVKNLFTPDKYKLIVIPSYRTPTEVIRKASNVFSSNHLVIKEIDKKAYLASLSLADSIIVTCDSTSMISEAAITGKPIYVAMMSAKRTNRRFKKFYTEFNNLGITRELTDKVDSWSYDKLDEVNRIAPIIKKKMKENGII